MGNREPFRGAGERCAFPVLAFPAMGAGFGGVPHDEAARQMAAAYQHYLNPPHRIDWDFVVERHKAISYHRNRQDLK